MEKEARLKLSKALKKYYKTHVHHTKGKHKSQEQRTKMSMARKRWLRKTDEELLKKIYKKMARTKRRTGVALGKNNPMYGKKRPDLTKWNRESWRDSAYRERMRRILSRTAYKGSKRQRELYNFLCKHFGHRNVKLNDWKLLNYKYQIDILICPCKIAIEWDGYHWHYEIEGAEERDLKKNEALIQKGWKFIRVKDNHLGKGELRERYEQILGIIEEYRDSNKLNDTAGVYI